MGIIMRDGVAYGGNTSVIYRNGIPYVSQGIPDYRIIPKTITENGTYNPSDDNCDGYSDIVVNVPSSSLTTKTITANGTYNASSDNVDGYSQVTVNVPAPIEVVSCSFTWRTSGVLISKDLSAYDFVILHCKNSAVYGSTTYMKDLYIGLPTDGTICWSGWQSSHNDGSSYITGNVRAQFYADSKGIYIAGYSNSNSRAAYNSLSFVKLYGIKSNMNWH